MNTSSSFRLSQELINDRNIYVVNRNNKRRKPLDRELPLIISLICIKIFKALNMRKRETKKNMTNVFLMWGWFEETSHCYSPFVESSGFTYSSSMRSWWPETMIQLRWLEFHPTLGRKLHLFPLSLRLTIEEIFLRESVENLFICLQLDIVIQISRRCQSSKALSFT